MFTIITGLIYENQSMTEMTENMEQKKDNDKEDAVFTGHRA